MQGSTQPCRKQRVYYRKSQGRRKGTHTTQVVGQDKDWTQNRNLNTQNQTRHNDAKENETGEDNDREKPVQGKTKINTGAWLWL